MGRSSFFIAVIVLLAGCSTPPRQEPALTAEGKAYVRNLPLSEVTMKATDSYAQQTLTEIEGQVKNAGNRTVGRVDVFCIFYDRNGILVLRERAGLIKSALRPGESRRFRLAFDDIPESWNNQLPALVIAQVTFG